MQPNFKTAYTMKKQEIKFDKRNYRLHNDENKRVIKKSLEELGAGRSIVIDSEGEIIAGNGVYEQAQKLGIKTKIVETDGSELVVVKRTDLATGDEKRKKLALADNAASDTSEWANDLLREDWTKEALADFSIELPNFNNEIKGNKELDVNSFSEEQELKLKFQPEQYSFVLAKLREYGDDFSQSLLLILGYHE